jgi:hypothetical protein
MSAEHNSDNEAVPEPSYPDWMLISTKDQTQKPQQSPPPYPDSSAPEISRSEAGFTAEKNGIESDSIFLTVLAIPYYGENVLFLPVIPGKLVYREEESPGNFKKISNKLKDRVKRWANLSPGSIRHKIYQAYQNHFLEEHPFQKFAKRMPGNIRGFRIIHPNSITKEQILKELYNGLHERFENRLGSTVIFGALLPLCVVLDLLTMGFLLTALDLTALLVSLNYTLDASYLDGLIKTEKVELENHPVLEEFDRNRRKHSHAIPNDQEIELFCQKLNFPKMAKTIKKVRDRQVILNSINSYNE